MMEKHGRANLPLVAEGLADSKTAEEVHTYARVFMRRLSELKNHDKILIQITKGEEKRMRNETVEKVLRDRIAACRKPLLELRVKRKRFSNQVYFIHLVGTYHLIPFILKTFFYLHL